MRLLYECALGHRAAEASVPAHKETWALYRISASLMFKWFFIARLQLMLRLPLLAGPAGDLLRIS